MGRNLNDYSAGTVYGNLTIMYEISPHIQPSGRKIRQFHCKCSCGNEIDVKYKYLCRGTHQNCGCLRDNQLHFNALEVESGEKYGRLTIISEANKWKGRRMFLCKCDCGNEVVVGLGNLRNGHTQSCGCLQSERAVSSNRKYNTYETKDEVTKVFDENGNFALIDTEDLERVKPYYWAMEVKSGYFVKRRSITSLRGNPTSLHRFIMDCPEGLVVDHLNHNRADNRKANLHICSIRDNSINQPVIGVTYLPHIGRWQVSVLSDRSIKYIDIVDTFDEAVELYRENMA